MVILTKRVHKDSNMQIINTVIQLLFALILLAVGITIAINGRWWSVYGVPYTNTVDFMIHATGVGIIIFSSTYISFIYKDSKTNKL